MLSNISLFHLTILITLIYSLMVIKPSYVKNQVIDVPGTKIAIIVIPIVVYCFASLPIVYTGRENDRGNYALSIIHYATANTPNQDKGDMLFAWYQFISSKLMNYKVWFYLTASIYVLNYFFTARRLCKQYAFVLFLMMLFTLQFSAYGSNTIRAGFAVSFVMLGISFYNKPYIMLSMFTTAFFCHSSMIIPVFMLLVSYRFRHNKVFLTFWLLSIVVSLIAGKTFEVLFQGFFTDHRVSYLNSTGSEGYKVGFRWDFLLYSAMPVISGYYYIYELNYKSFFYEFVWRAYLGANAFWVLVIRANFTDRFAYLSWFMFPILLFYPFLTQQLYKNVSEHHNKLVMLMLGQAAFIFGISVWKGL